MFTELNLHTIGLMSDAVIDGYTSQATDHPASNVLDRRTNTYWQPTTNFSVQDIDIDLGSTKAVDSYGLWIHNYNFSQGTQNTVSLFGSADGIAWGTALDTISFLNITGSGLTDGAHILDSTGTPWSYRYFRLRFDMSGQALDKIEISGIYLCDKWTAAQGPQAPIVSRPTFYNERLQVGGHLESFPVHGGVNDSFTRKYIFVNTTGKDAIEDAFEDCEGSRYPLLINEAASGDYRLVKFNQDQLTIEEVTADYFRIEVSFLQVPHIAPGKVL